MLHHLQQYVSLSHDPATLTNLSLQNSAGLDSGWQGRKFVRYEWGYQRHATLDSKFPIALALLTDHETVVEQRAWVALR